MDAGARRCAACGAAQPSTGILTRIAQTPDWSLPDDTDPLLERLRAATLGSYEILGRIGRGGMAAVFVAHDIDLGRKVAIKVMLPELSVVPTMSDRFKQEARTAAALSHPNVIIIHAVREVDGLLFFVMNFVRGCSLEVLMRELAPLPLTLVQALLAQVVHALHYAHTEGVVHRDVKPGNVMISAKGDAVITDFGIARAKEAPNLTQPGSAIGTPTYMSPEQCMGGVASSASDQYSLGVVAYELLTGTAPFTGTTLEVQWAHTRHQPTPLAEVRPDLPASLAEAVTRMLEKEPGARWPTLLDALPGLTAECDLGAQTAARARLAELAHSRSVYNSASLGNTPASPVPTVPTPPLLEISAAAQRVEVGDAVRLAATVTGGAAAPPAGAMAWSSDDVRVATVSDDGLVTGIAPGTATVTAAWETLRVGCTVTVVAPEVAAVVVSPRSATMGVDDELALTAIVRDARGRRFGDRTITWSSSDPDVVQVSDAGVVTARGVGDALVRAACEDREGVATLAVVSTTAEHNVPPEATPIPSRSIASATMIPRAVSPDAARAVSAPEPPTAMTPPPASGTVSEPETSAEKPGVSDTSSGAAALPPSSSPASRPPPSATAAGAAVRGTVGEDVGRTPRSPAARADTAPNATDDVHAGAGVPIIDDPPRERGGRRMPVWLWPVAGVVVLGAVLMVAMRGGPPDEPTVEKGGGVDVVTPPVAPPAPPPAPLVLGDSIAAFLDVAAAPRDARVSVGERVGLRAVVRNAKGDTLAGYPVVWHSSDTSVATVSDGVVTGIRRGTVAISAEVDEGAPASVELAVVGVQLAFRDVPATASLTIGQPIEIRLPIVDLNRGGRLVGDAAVRVTPGRHARAEVRPSPPTLHLTGESAGTDTIVLRVGQQQERIAVTVNAAPRPPDGTPVQGAPAPPSDRLPPTVVQEFANATAVRMWYASDDRYGGPLQQQLAGHPGQNERAGALLSRLRRDRPDRCTSDEAQLSGSGTQQAVSFTVTCAWRPAFGRAQREAYLMRALVARRGTGWLITALELR